MLIIVCDNVDIAEISCRKISGEEPFEAVTEEDIAEVEAEENGDEERGMAFQAAPHGQDARATLKAKPKVSYWHGVIFPEHFANSPEVRRAIHIDTDLLAKAESKANNKSKKELAEELRWVVATIGKRGEPGEHVRCVVSVQMLTEGWDANNVTHIRKRPGGPWGRRLQIRGSGGSA